MTRERLPEVYTAGAGASLLELIAPRTRGLMTYGIVAKVSELTATYSRSGKLWRAARWLVGASLVATLLSRHRIAGALGTAAGLLSRLAGEPQHKMSSSWTRVR